MNKATPSRRRVSAKPTWVGAILAYASDRCGTYFASLQEADDWLRRHPENPLNKKAVRKLFTLDSHR